MSEIAYIADARREKWLRELQQAREAGEIAVTLYGITQPEPAEVIPFPQRAPQPTGDDAA